MGHIDTVRRLSRDPEQLEEAYRQAVQASEEAEFSSAIDAEFERSGDNLLLAAWHYRLAYGARHVARSAIAWTWAIPLAVVNGLVLWWLSANERQVSIVNPFSGTEYDVVPVLVLLAAPVSSAVVALFLAGAGRRAGAWALGVVVALVLLCAYVLLVYPRAGPRPFQEQYLILMVMHLALAGWAAVGVVALAARNDIENRFAFLEKSLEFVVVGGLFVAAGGVFTAVTVALFDALDVQLPEAVWRLFYAGGAGVIAVLTAALVADPLVAPKEQPFAGGPSRMVSTLLRILLPFSVMVLAVYVALIPFHFRAPFESREVLIAYSAMLFAVLGLIVGATPLHSRELQARLAPWLRRGIVLVAALAVVVGIYALAAIGYRTVEDRLTPNRLAFIGWNVINVFVLAGLVAGQLRSRAEDWLADLHRSLAVAAAPYALWTLLVILATPWLFGVDAAAYEDLPEEIQTIAFESPHPVLLKCSGSPEIYLLEDGRKRWIRDIPTFEGEGFQWRDVHFTTCGELAAVPDGLPIPEDAGSPPSESDR